MNGPALSKNVGAWLHGENALDAAVITAGAGNDGVAVNGNIIDLQTLQNQGKKKFHSAKLMIPFTAVLAAAATLTATVVVQHGSAANLSDAATYLDELGVNGKPATIVATGPGGGGTVRGVIEVSIALGGAKRYIRSVVTLNLSAATVDTVAAGGAWVLGAPEEAPVGSNP
jgi:hypothetical protein